jgi:hypothetical protein
VALGRNNGADAKLSFLPYVYTHTFSFRVCLKSGRRGKVHKRGVTFSKTVLKH